MEKSQIRKGLLAGMQVNLRVKLAALWVALMFCYTYADILGFYAPGNLAELLGGEIAGIRMTSTVLLGSAILMLVPIAMIYLTVALPAKASRVANVAVGIVYLCVLAGTFFTGRNPAYYLLFAAAKAFLLAGIVWMALKWPREKLIN